MTREDMGKIMALLQATYPNYYRGLSDKDAKSVVNIWAEMFADDPEELVTAAVKRLILSDNKGFPPVIGQIKEQMYKITYPDEMNAQEAWGQVKKAVRRYCRYDRPEENPYYGLPEEVRRAIGGPGQIRDWAMMEEEAFDTVEGSHFKKAYAAAMQRKRELEKLPGDIREMMGRLSGGFSTQGLKPWEMKRKEP